MSELKRVAFKWVVEGVPVTTTNSQRIFTPPGKTRPIVMRSAEAERWMKSAKRQLRAQTPMGWLPLNEPADIELRVYRLRNSGDVDNYAKGIIDVLKRKHAHIIEDDRIFRKLTVEVFVATERPRVEIIIRPRQMTLFNDVP